MHDFGRAIQIRDALLGCLVAAPLLAGCASGVLPPRVVADAEPFDACDRPISLDEVARRASENEAVFIGETHGHALGLAVEASLFERIAARKASAALSMEFLERDTQTAVDDYLAGRIDRKTFVKRARLGGHDPEPGHLAMIDTAKRLGLPVVASNAPRAYAKRARIEGFEALRGLGPDEQRLFVVPDVLPSGRYLHDFTEMMGGGASHAGALHTGPHPAGHGASHASPHGGVDGFFRAQALWDATMADSVAREIDAERHPVVHVVGRFHTDHEGGLIQMLARERPATHIFKISIVETRDDVSPGLADAVIVVGETPDTDP